jgi:Amt family ammonium transporter
VPFFACTKLKALIGYDDSLDTFGIHGVGGTLGAILTAVFADSKVNPNLISDAYAKVNGLAKFFGEDGKASSGLLVNHVIICAGTIVLSVVVTAVLAYAIKFTIGLRASEEAETQGLDVAEHGEEGYHGA